MLVISYIKRDSRAKFCSVIGQTVKLRHFRDVRPQR